MPVDENNAATVNSVVNTALELGWQRAAHTLSRAAALMQQTLDQAHGYSQKLLR